MAVTFDHGSLESYAAFLYLLLMYALQMRMP